MQPQSLQNVMMLKLTLHKLNLTKPKLDLTKAQEADAKKASDLATAKETETVQSATADKTASALAQAQADATKAAADLVNANTAVDKAQKALDGTGATAIIAERDDAASYLTQAQADETKAQSDLTAAQAADAKKARDIASLTQTQTQQQATANQTAAALATATADAKTKADAKTAADNKVAELTAQIDAIENMTVPTLSQDVIDAYKKFVNDDSQVNKDALATALLNWYNSQSKATTPVDTTVVDPQNLTASQATALTQYYVYLANSLQDQVWGKHEYVVTEEAIAAIQNIANAYASENQPWSSGHSHTALNADGNSTISWSSENMGTGAKNTTTMTDMYTRLYNVVVRGFMVADESSDFGHMITMIGSTMPGTLSVAVGVDNSVTASGTARLHFVTFYGTTKTVIASPYDTTALKAQLATAKTTQAQATAANTQAQSTLASATTANQQAQSALQATTTQLNTLKATADQTPAAQAKLAVATATRQAAETRLANAQQVVDNFNADVVTKTKALEDAKAVQTQAVATDTKAKEVLAQATTANDNAQTALSATRKTIATLEATPDQTLAAEAQLQTATATRQAAEIRLTNAQQAVDNLNADVATKTKALEDAKTQLAAEEAKLAQLKEAKSTSEVVLAEAQSKVKALKAEEAKIADEITVLKAQLTEQVAKLAALKNADQVLTDAQAELAKAIEAHTVAKATLDAEIDKLDQFLKNQRDAKAQYEAVKEAYTQAQIVAQRQAINDTGGQPIAITDKVGKIAGYFDGNQTAGTKLQPITYSRVEKYRQLPQTGSQESLLVLLGYTALAGLGLGYAKKRRRG
ncbi:TPA: SEC10/PgrA surface exclusion domain-containing protein [Streptococcus suis]|nr:SEC10/PgrA surface exclusion domain-containing protein [Streptococcus suis]